MNIRISLCTGLVFAAAPAFSAELEYALRGGLTTSDNIERLPDGFERSASVAVAGIEMRGERPEGRLRYAIATDISYNEYLGRDLDSEPLGRASLRGSYDFVPDAFGWNASLAYDQVREDILRALAPGNTEEVLTLSTGPTLRARFSEVMEASLDGHVARTSYSERPTDNETLGGRVMLARRASPRSLLAIGGSYDDVSYTGAAPAGLDFERKEAFARLELKGVRTDVNVEGGYADISGPGVDGGGAVLRARLSRRVTPSVTGFLNAVREYPTSEETALTADPTVSGGGDHDSAELSSGPRLTTSVGAGLRFVRARTEAEIAYTHREEESELAGAGKRKYGELRGQLTRRFTPRARGTLFAVMADEDIAGTAGSAEDRSLGAEVGISLGRAMGLDLRVEHRKRNGITAADGYSELSGGLFLRYSGQL